MFLQRGSKGLRTSSDFGNVTAGKCPIVPIAIERDRYALAGLTQDHRHLSSETRLDVKLFAIFGVIDLLGIYRKHADLALARHLQHGAERIVGEIAADISLDQSPDPVTGLSAFLNQRLNWSALMKSMHNDLSRRHVIVKSRKEHLAEIGRSDRPDNTVHHHRATSSLRRRAAELARIR